MARASSQPNASDRDTGPRSRDSQWNTGISGTEASAETGLIAAVGFTLPVSAGRTKVIASHATVPASKPAAVPGSRAARPRERRPKIVM
ncbi:hypothetical protein DKT77_18835 [Meridianimarinicoccus roseus]|uniref:Uncharacterized protein n=1 Tax=Meridianimarinicoccus roseus TaxID=2072018 RepID=A0A2V2L6M6_9RHOB|nr:hypothetical protein DKT77_18835 [Meridianimarinicoccus roseus]